jgi:hypothetical protein
LKKYPTPDKSSELVGFYLYVYIRINSQRTSYGQFLSD